MRSPIFLDTSGWLAALVPSEQSHQPLSEAYQDLIRSAGRVVTTNLVVAEMHILITRRLGAETGLRFLQDLYDEPTHEVQFVTREIEAAAVERWLPRLLDHSVSLTDAVSFEVMRIERITRAMALDRHFVMAGFELVP